MSAQEHDRTPLPPSQLTNAERIAIALDGAPPVSDERAIVALRLAMLYDQLAYQRTLERIRQWSPRAIAVVSGPLSSPRHLLETLDVPHSLVGSLSQVSTQASVIILGCQDARAVDSSHLERALDRGVTLVSSDKSALIAPLRGLLRPQSQRPARSARLRWTHTTPYDIPTIDPPDIPCTAQLHSGVYLSPGYVPIAPPVGHGPSADVLAVDALSSEPLIVRLSVGRGALLHAVPHWWQNRGVDRTAFDRRRIADIPGYGRLREIAGDVSVGEFEAVRTMTAGLIRALWPMLE